MLCPILDLEKYILYSTKQAKARKTMSWFWSSGGPILTQIKKNAGRKINTTTRKIPSPVFSSPVNHRHPRSSAF